MIFIYFFIYQHLDVLFTFYVVVHLCVFINVLSCRCIMHFFLISTACGVCETSLGNDTMQLLTKFQSYWNQTLTFQLIQQQDSALGILEIGIRNAMTQTGLASGYDLVTNLTNLIQQLQQTATASQANVSNLNNHVRNTA